MLQKKQLRGLRRNGKVLLDLGILSPAERRIRQDDLVLVLGLNGAHILLKRVLPGEVRGANAVQNHVHNP
jgi:hypothetical protein